MNIFGTDIIHLRDVRASYSHQKKATYRAIGKKHHGITLRIGGHARFLSEDNTLLMDSLDGAITFMPANYPHIHQHIEPSEVIGIHFNSDELTNCKPFVFYPLDRQNFHHLFNNSFDAWKENPEPSTVRMIIAAYKIFEAIIEAGETQQIGCVSGALIKAVKYIRQQFPNSKLSVAECASAAGISEIYLRRLFSKEVKVSPARYLLNFRIAYAKNLLDSGNNSVKEIAAFSGFSSPSYFCRVFRANTGISPLEYKALCEPPDL